MKHTLLAILIHLAISACAQSSLISAETLWIHKVSATSDGDDLESFFPIIKSPKNPVLATNINKVLQMEMLGFIMNGKNETALLEPVEFSSGDGNYSFSYQPINDRLIAIVIGRYHRNNQMSLNGYFDNKNFMFDAYTGQPVDLNDLFTSQGWNTLKGIVAQDLKKDFFRSMSSFKEGFSEKDLPKLQEECGCDCMAYINDSFCNGTMIIGIDVNTKTFSFQIPDCDWMNPRPHDTYSTSVPFSRAPAIFSDYGLAATLGTSKALDNSLTQLWKGTLGEKLPIHFLLKSSLCQSNTGSGLEVYDRYGICISLSFNVSGQQITIHELDAQGKKVATIKATEKDGTLTGSWTKSDGSKTLAFKAIRA